MSRPVLVESGLHIRVADNGAGIPRAVLDRLFQHIRVALSNPIHLTHKDKYGNDYDTRSGSAYSRP